jgi:UDP-N-acetylglucosamine 2-epimerase (non-hydrolysing)
MSPLIHVLLGTKAELIKVAPVLAELDHRGIAYRLVETGQHGAYLPGLRGQLGVREPDVRLGGHSDVDGIWQAVRWMAGLTGRLVGYRSLVERVFGGAGGVCLVHGDTPSTLMATLMARRAGLAIAHLESGLRSGSFLAPFPEELIRVLVMRRADVMLAPDASAAANLASMGVRGRVVRTSGNTGQEALAGVVAEVEPGSGKVVAALHRVENLRRPARLRSFLDLLGRLAANGLEVLFVVHPPTGRVLAGHGGRAAVEAAGVATSDLLPFADFAAQLAAAPFVVTDGGSIQEECALLGVPCLLWRDRTERPDGVGENVVVGRYDDAVVERFLADPEAHRRPVRASGARPSVEVADVLVGMLDAGWSR